MSGNAVVMVSDERIETFFKGRLLASYPRRLWEISRTEGDQVLWCSRERTREEWEKLLLTLRQSIRRNGGSGMEVKETHDPEEEEGEWEEAA